MAYVADTEKALKAVGKQSHYGESKQCVAAVKHFCRAPQTLHWRKSIPVKGNHSIQKGTAIATFEAANGGYQGHAAIYMGQDGNAIQVLDQWDGSGSLSKFGLRPIHFNRPQGTHVSNVGELYYVVD